MILILGSKGMLGGQLKKIFPDAVAWDRDEFDFSKIINFKLEISNLHPSAIINCVAFNDVDGAEDRRDLAFTLNSTAVGELAGICHELKIPLVHFSTNYVFDGQKGEYLETDQPHPLSVYAQSKCQGELEIQKNTDQFYIIRTAVLFGPKGESELSKKSFIELMLDLSAKSDTIKAVIDEVNSVTFVADLAVTVKKILTDTWLTASITLLTPARPVGMNWPRKSLRFGIKKSI